MFKKRQLLSIILLSGMGLNSSDASQDFHDGETAQEVVTHTKTRTKTPKVHATTEEGMKIVFHMMQEDVKKMRLHDAPKWNYANKGIRDVQANQHLSRLNGLIKVMLDAKRQQTAKANFVNINFQGTVYICEALGMFQESVRGILGYLMIRPHPYYFRALRSLKELEANFLFVNQLLDDGQSFFGDMPDLAVVKTYLKASLDIFKEHIPILMEFERKRTLHHRDCSIYGADIDKELVKKFEHEKEVYEVEIQNIPKKFQVLLEMYRKSL